jgi:hypothetical protein
VGIQAPVAPHPTAPARVPDAAGELDAEVARLLRVRAGELAEPLLWRRPSHHAEVEAVVAQLAPIRSRLGLLWSYEREAHRDSPLRLGYAIAWLRLAQRRAGEFGGHRRPAAAYPKTKPKSIAKR